MSRAEARRGTRAEQSRSLTALRMRGRIVRMTAFATYGSAYLQGSNATAASPPPAQAPRVPAWRLFCTTGNHSGLAAPVAFRIGPITCAICSGAASTVAFMIGSPSHAANAAPSART